MNTRRTLICAPTTQRILKSFLVLLFSSAVSIGQPHTVVSRHNMVLVGGGTFQMGDDHGYEMEKPVHTVRLKSYYMDKYEVTVGEYRKFCIATKREMPEKPAWGWNDKNPISKVCWDDAASYAAWAGKRLPTEAEWEFAARGGTQSKGWKYSGSDNIDEVAWYVENSKNKVHPVGTKKRNELGIFDMTGNVVEWCADKYDGNYYKVSPEKNPQGSHIGSDRVLRGGSYSGDTDDCRIAKRFSRKPGTSLLRFGFRCAAEK